MSKNNRNVSALSLLLITPIEIALGIPVLLFSAYVMVEIWGWWGVPAGFPVLPFWTAVALDFLYALVRGNVRDIIGTAEFGAIYEEADGDFEFLLSSMWWMIKRRSGSAFYVLITWATAFFLHRAVE